jgi:hypothetical protein
MNIELSGAGDAWPALRQQLESAQGRFPREVLAAVMAQREAVAPQLVAVLEAVARNPAQAVREMQAGSMELLYAMHLLAYWRDTRAYRPLLAIGHLPPKLVMDGLLDDVVHESYGRCLASVCDADMAPLRALIEDGKASVWVRAAALSAWTIRVQESDAAFAEYVDYLRELGLRAAQRLRDGQVEAEGAEMLTLVVSEATDVAARELLPLIRGWFDEGLVDTTFIDRRFVEQTMAQSPEQRQRQRVRRNDTYITDVAHELSWLYRPPEHSERPTPPPPVCHPVRTEPKIGRNDPCPCGSGKKFKKCHGA